MTQLNLHKNSFNIPNIVTKFINLYKLWNEYRDNLPKKCRFTLGNKIDWLFIEIIELLYTASYLKKHEKLPYLKKSIKRLDVLKFFFQVAWDIKVLDNKKYINISTHMDEIGRMLGGWTRGIESKTPAEKQEK